MKTRQTKNKSYLLCKGELLTLIQNMSVIFYEEIKVINIEKKFIKHRIYVRMFDKKKLF